METKLQTSTFAKETLKGLTCNPKELLPKYFYDDRGSKIFRQIMRMPSYYPTRCEFDIFLHQSENIVEELTKKTEVFDLIELGPGDGLKSKLLIKVLLEKGINFRYLPVDISEEALDILVNDLEREYPHLSINEHPGDYFEVLKNLNTESSRTKVILFLGGNIGNFNAKARKGFMSQLQRFTNSGDFLLTGFDLKKSPQKIVDAYKDPEGITEQFNLNHLMRINKELNADFDINMFEHHVSYNPVSGSMKSYLVSKIKQNVYIRSLDEMISFEAWEPVFMELSKKYSIDIIETIAEEYQFECIEHFNDSDNYFTDSLWIRK